MVPLGEKSWGKLAGAVFVWCFSPLSEFSGMPETHLENGMMEHVSGFLNFSLFIKKGGNNHILLFLQQQHVYILIRGAFAL